MQCHVSHLNVTARLATGCLTSLPQHPTGETLCAVPTPHPTRSSTWPSRASPVQRTDAPCRRPSMTGRCTVPSDVFGPCVYGVPHRPPVGRSLDDCRGRSLGRQDQWLVSPPDSYRHGGWCRSWLPMSSSAGGPSPCVRHVRTHPSLFCLRSSLPRSRIPEQCRQDACEAPSRSFQHNSNGTCPRSSYLPTFIVCLL